MKNLFSKIYHKIMMMISEMQDIPDYTIEEIGDVEKTRNILFNLALDSRTRQTFPALAFWKQPIVKSEYNKRKE